MAKRVLYLGEPVMERQELPNPGLQQYVAKVKRIGEWFNDPLNQPAPPEADLRNLYKLAANAPKSSITFVPVMKNGKYLRSFPRDKEGRPVPSFGMLEKFTFHFTGNQTEDGYPEYLCPDLSEEDARQLGALTNQNLHTCMILPDKDPGEVVMNLLTKMDHRRGESLGRRPYKPRGKKFRKQELAAADQES